MHKQAHNTGGNIYAHYVFEYLCSRAHETQVQSRELFLLSFLDHDACRNSSADRKCINKCTLHTGNVCRLPYRMVFRLRKKQLYEDKSYCFFLFLFPWIMILLLAVIPYLPIAAGAPETFGFTQYRRLTQDLATQNGQ